MYIEYEKKNKLAFKKIAMGFSNWYVYESLDSY